MKTVIRQNVDLAKAPALAQDIFEFAPNLMEQKIMKH